jgi:hypothetical protein
VMCWQERWSELDPPSCHITSNIKSQEGEKFQLSYDIKKATLSGFLIIF